MINDISEPKQKFSRCFYAVLPTVILLSRFGICEINSKWIPKIMKIVTKDIGNINKLFIERNHVIKFLDTYLPYKVA